MPLVVSNRAHDFDALVAQAAREARLGDVLELRLDECSDVSEERLRAAFASLEKPVIVAVNGPEAFGSFAGTLGQRLDCLRRAARAGARYVDIDAPNAAALGSVAAGCTRILSSHSAPAISALPTALFDELRQCARPGDLLKLVTHVASAEDGLALLVELARHTLGLEPAASRWIAFSSGERGRFTRVLAPLSGSHFSYAAPSVGDATAPGQWRADELRRAWPAGGPRRVTRIFGVVGNPARHSLSPALHGAEQRAQGLDAVYVDFEAQDFERFLALAHALPVAGLSVTAPFKGRALAAADESDARARAVGAANTLVRTASGWRATNTDVAGALAALERGLRDVHEPRLHPPRVLILGAGGAARAALAAARELGARTTLAARDATRASVLAREFGAKALDWSQIPSSEHDALIHCTPLGSLAQPGLTPIPADWIRAGTLVIDAIYRPRDTALLQAARARGAHTIAGGEWFVEQAAAQFELFHARPADRARLHATLEHMLAGSHAARPIALIGMRASGKTSVGIALAAVLGCPFIDLDRELEREYLARTARPLRAGEVLARDGEAHFRDLEQEVLARELALPAPRVLATGGGVVERATNRELLGRSATCVWLSVPPAELARRLRADPTPRPALVGTDPAAEVSTLLARREEWYQSLAQVVVDVSQATPTELAWCVAVELDLQSKP